MSAERDIIPDKAAQAEAESDARAMADIAAGRVVDHAYVVAWLETWGTADHKPMPREWFE